MTAWEKAQDPRTLRQWARSVGLILGVLLAGWVIQGILFRMVVGPIHRLESRPTTPWFTGLVIPIIGRLGLRRIPVAAFGGVAYGLLSLAGPSQRMGVIILLLVNAYLLAGVITRLGRALAEPDVEHLRLVPLNNEGAQYVCIWIRRMAFVAIYGFTAIKVAALLTLPENVGLLMQSVVGLILTAMAVVLILQNREPVSAWIRGDSETHDTMQIVRNRLAATWHVVALIYVILVFVVWMLQIEGGFLFLTRAAIITIVVPAIARLVIIVADRIIDRGIQLNDDLRARYPLLESRVNRYIPAGKRLIHTFIGAVAVVIILDAWGTGLIGWLSSDSGQVVIARLITIGVLIIVAQIIWEIVNVFIERALEENGDAVYKTRRDRVRIATLLPLFRHVVRVVLIGLVVLISLSELGINIAPLLAAAGVLGLAVGFGAQTLVKDIINGVFILLEDGIAVDDIVDVGNGHAGVVESMSIRTVTLRDLGGTVHVIPFGEVTSIKNLTREFAFALLDVGVAYREDLNEVIATLKEVAEGLCQDPEFQNDILEPLEVLGLDEFGDSALIVKVRLKTLPAKQWRVKREYNARIKEAFDAKGIEIPFPHHTIYFGEDKSGKAPPAFVELLAQNDETT